MKPFSLCMRASLFANINLVVFVGTSFAAELPQQDDHSTRGNQKPAVVIAEAGDEDTNQMLPNADRLQLIEKWADKNGWDSIILTGPSDGTFRTEQKVVQPKASYGKGLYGIDQPQYHIWIPPNYGMGGISPGLQGVVPEHGPAVTPGVIGGGTGEVQQLRKLVTQLQKHIVMQNAYIKALEKQLENGTKK